MNIAIIGTRDWRNTKLIERTVKYIARLDIDSVIVSGAGGNVDTTAESAANDNELAKLIYPAKWRYYEKQGNKRSAGPLRNMDIELSSDIVIAFHDGKSTGTAGCVALFEKSSKPRLVVKLEWTEDAQIAEIRAFLDLHLKAGK